MTTMRILFLHGWTSVPGGVKPTYLKDHGHTVLNPSLNDADFEAAVRTAQAEYDQHRPDVIVGSSRGGAVAMNINSGNTPLVLLCPAWKNWGTVTKLKPQATVLHSRKDDVIPFADSEELVARSGLSPETLIEVGQDHRLADPEPLKAMLDACERLEDAEFRDLFREQLRQATNWDQDSAISKVAQLQEELSLVRQQQKRLTNHLLLEEINPTTYAETARDLRDREAELKLEIDVADRGRHEIIDIAVKAFELSQSLREKWLTADYAAKRRILEIICLNCSLDGVSLVTTIRKPFDLLAKGLLQKDSRGDRI